MKEGVELTWDFIGMRLGASFLILTFLSVPWFFIAKKNWDYIKSALAGTDGITDVHELKIGLSFIILICFMIIYFFMVITKGALLWEWTEMHFTYTFLGTTGAEIGVIVAIVQNWRKPKV